MIITELEKNTTICLAPFLNLNFKCSIVKTNVNIIGNNAGYILKLATNSPSSNKSKAL